MAAAPWMKEHKLLMFLRSSSETRLWEDDNIESELMDARALTRARAVNLSLKISPANLLGRFALIQLSPASGDLFPICGLTCKRSSSFERNISYGAKGAVVICRLNIGYEQELRERFSFLAM